MAKEVESNGKKATAVASQEEEEVREDKINEAENLIPGKDPQVIGKMDVENPPPKDKAKGGETEEEMTEMQAAMRLAFAFVGLQTSYILWGYMQEKVMSQLYGEDCENHPDNCEKFPSANFCVMSNRTLAIMIGLAVTLYRHQTITFAGAPLTSFAPCAMSNTMSSWGQYEALKFISFPLQTLAKSTKIIPVMIMGKVLNKRTYPWIEYAEAAMISVGVNVFMLSEKEDPNDDRTTKLYGIALLVLYVTSDSFTSQWQSRVYKDYPKVDQFQMMCAVNFWAIIFSITQWIVFGEAGPTLRFLAKYPTSIYDNILISITSATGQLFIFYTIKTFGPVVFTIIMTTRQIFSLVLSTVLFNHRAGIFGWLGVAIVFATLFYQVHRKRQAKKSGKAGGGGGGA